jgi:hypothetical protein
VRAIALALRKAGKCIAKTGGIPAAAHGQLAAAAAAQLHLRGVSLPPYPLVHLFAYAGLQPNCRRTLQIFA